MTKEEIIRQVETIFHEILNREDIELTFQTTANDIDGWDSLTNMRIIAKIEETFNCRFNFREIVKFKNVGDLCDTLLNKLG